MLATLEVTLVALVSLAVLAPPAVARATSTLDVDGNTTPPVTTVVGAFPTYGSVQLGVLASFLLNATDGGSGVAHTYYIFDGDAQTEGTWVVENVAIGTHTLVYWSVDDAGNVEPFHVLTGTVYADHSALPPDQNLSCFVAGCHGDYDGVTPSIITIHGDDPYTDCFCHGAGLPTGGDCEIVGCHSTTDANPIVDPHPIANHPVITSVSPTACTTPSCHGTDLVSDSTHPDCLTCHGSSDPVVQSVIASGLAGTSATCESCHTNEDGGTTSTYTAIHSAPAAFTLFLYTAGANGTIRGTDHQAVGTARSGTSVTAVADPGYHFVRWSDGRTTATRTDVGSTATERDLVASFAPNVCALSFRSNGGSAIATITRSYGATVTAPAAPTKHGYAFAGWYSDQNLTTPHVFSTMGLTTTLYAKWSAASTFTLSSTTGAHGAISPAGTQTVDYRDTKTFTITPAAGYHTVAVLVDGASVGVRSSITFRNVTAGHTISATFAITVLKTSLSITSNKATAVRGTSVAFSGTISPNVPNGTHVVVQIRPSVSTTWTALATRSTFSSRRWSYSYKIPKTQARGTFYVSVCYAGTEKYLPCTSGTRKLVIK